GNARQEECREPDQQEALVVDQRAKQAAQVDLLLDVGLVRDRNGEFGVASGSQWFHGRFLAQLVSARADTLPRAFPGNARAGRSVGGAPAPGGCRDSSSRLSRMLPPPSSAGSARPSGAGVPL